MQFNEDKQSASDFLNELKECPKCGSKTFSGVFEDLACVSWVFENGDFVHFNTEDTEHNRTLSIECDECGEIIFENS